MSKREIDDYLADSNIVLDYHQRRSLFRTWRNIRRIARDKQSANPGEWRTRDNNKGKAWSDDEDADIRASFTSGTSIEAIAAAHKRSVISVRYRLQKHGFILEENRIAEP